MFIHPMQLLFVAPAFLLALWAQWRVKSAYAHARQVPATMSGASAARRVLDAAGLHAVQIEEVPGTMTDHYDPRAKVLRLSPEVYESSSMAAVGIAAHEAGHALQDANQYALMSIRNAIVPVANFGSGLGVGILFLGFLMHAQGLVLAGIVLFAAVVAFQLVNLPVEFNASARAKTQLVGLGIIHPNELPWINEVLNAAAWTYVAATLESVMTLVYYLTFFLDRGDSRRE
jgi:uncharacterized protein